MRLLERLSRKMKMILPKVCSVIIEIEKENDKENRIYNIIKDRTQFFFFENNTITIICIVHPGFSVLFFLLQFTLTKKLNASHFSYAQHENTKSNTEMRKRS